MTVEHEQIVWGPALEHDLRQLVRLAINEDLQRGYDITSVPLIPREATGRAHLVTRQDGVIAGLRTGAILLDEMSSSAEWTAIGNDGDRITAGQTVAELTGMALDILTAERILLNTIGHLSGVASLTRQYVDAVEGTAARVCDTRKTLPGWRRLEKFAVRCGGGTNHRLGLYDAVLIKDNHLAFGEAASQHGFDIAEAVARAHAYVSTLPGRVIVQVEVDSVEQLQRVLPSAPDIVLLDNISAEQLAEAVAIRDGKAPKVMLEASGGVTLETIRAIAESGVDRISVGAITHSAKQLDVGLDWSQRSS